MPELMNVLNRIQMEYVEMPDLKLTLQQARRLWNLDSLVCEAAMDALVAVKFLRQTPDGKYLRRTSPPSSSTPAS
jgi:hypothetical protein